MAENITLTEEGTLVVPDHPIIPFIEGDGVGPDIWRATRMVLDAAVKGVYGNNRGIEWVELHAGEKAVARHGGGEWLPESTLEAIERYRVAIKGPLTTPVGGGYRSLNVTIRQKLDLYACVRPVRYFSGVPSPMKHPELLDVVIFRENTEDVYAGIEWQAGSPEADALRDFVQGKTGYHIREGSGIGLKPISEFGSKRLVRKAVRYALDKKRRSVTLVHKGNIMKWTEGAFREWGYEAASEFGSRVYREGENAGEGAVLIKDRIADSMFQQVLLRPAEYDVIATTNLNGDYISDACAAQVGGLGMAPGANIGDGIAVFEATHGTAPKYAGQDKVNPCSLILSGVMMLEYLGWDEAARVVVDAVQETITAKIVTYDLARQMEGARKISCTDFARAVVKHLGG